MQPVALLVVFAVLFGLVHLWWLPLAKDRWLAADMRAKMARAGLLAVLEKVRTLCVVGICAVGLVLLAVVLANWLGGAGVLWPKAAIEAAASVYQSAKAIADGYGAALAAIGAIAAVVVLWLAARQAKRRVIDVWMQQAQREHEAIVGSPGTELEFAL